MKQRDYYITPKAGRIMRALWKAAGGDQDILKRATYSDQIKYMCLGGIVFATGAMAGLAGGYAFYTIFSPKTNLGELENSPLHILMAIVFGIIWGLMIFNIDRFIVTSTGKGDGTEKITWDEFKSAIPRIIMGAIIAITISKPIEIRMFQTEIQSKLIEKKQEQEATYREAVEKRHKNHLQQLDNDINQLNVEIKDKKIELNTKNDLAIVKCGSNNPNCKYHIGIWNMVKDAKKEYEDVKTKNEQKIKVLQDEKDTTLAIKERELNNAQKDG